MFAKNVNYIVYSKCFPREDDEWIELVPDKTRVYSWGGTVLAYIKCNPELWSENIFKYFLSVTGWKKLSTIHQELKIKGTSRLMMNPEEKVTEFVSRNTVFYIVQFFLCLFCWSFSLRANVLLSFRFQYNYYIIFRIIASTYRRAYKLFLPYFSNWKRDLLLIFC